MIKTKQLAKGSRIMVGYLQEEATRKKLGLIFGGFRSF